MWLSKGRHNQSSKLAKHLRYPTTNNNLTMAPKLTKVATTALIFAFALITFVFSILAITSRDWARQHNFDYPPELSDLDWVNVTSTRYRSPFKICNTFLIPTNDGTPSRETTMNCTHFKAYGFNRTSCELAIATQSDGATNVGDARLCQQIHYAGNFGIASSTFFGLAFVFTLIMVAHTFMARSEASQPASSEQSHPTEDESANPNHSEPDKLVSNTTKHPTSSQRKSKLPIFAFVNLFLVIFLAIAIITALISQLYGILGLIQSLPNNSDFSSSKGQDVGDMATHGTHGPWFQGKALSIYLTCAWGFAIATMGLASMTWALPRLEIV
jgi:hypothetical protein